MAHLLQLLQMFNKYKAIIYDFDGVIVDSVNIKTQAFIKLYKEFGNDILSKVKEYHELNGGISRQQKIKYFHNELLNININDKEINNLSNKFSSIVKQKVIECNFISGAEKFLQLMSMKKKLQFVCTGTPQDEIIDIIIARNLNPYFTEIFGSPSSKISIIKNILNNYNLKFSEVLMFGDAITEYKAAISNNIDFIGISSYSPFPENIIVFPNFNKIF